MFAYGAPNLTLESPAAPSHFFYNLIVTTMERRLTTQHYVKHDSDTPQITFLVVVA